jgi:serine/threonine protein kinase
MRPYAPGREVAPGVRVLAHLHRSNDLDVYDARCARRACRVVVKTTRPDRARAARALVREGRLLRRLTHPHIVRCYEVHPGPRPAIVLETLTGETLAHLIATRRLGAADVAELARQLASALVHLHAEGVLHLDLKPSNVVAEAGRAKLLDLSIARAPGRVPAGLGTARYMAPEQRRGGQVAAAADVWGLGGVLRAAADGARLPRRLAAAIDACLRPEPELRPAPADLLALR